MNVFASLGLLEPTQDAAGLRVRSPIDGAELARLAVDDAASADRKIARSAQAFLSWRSVPAPVRGELVRRFGQVLREAKPELARIITLEAGKIVSEAEGEVQEMIDVCDFAVGLSRQLYGLTIASERPDHAMRETWRPLGPVGVISAFNFPAAVWAWNAALALVCGDPVIWKPSEKTPLTALACAGLFGRATEGLEQAPEGLVEVLIGGAEIGERLVDDPRVPLVSATGSTAMGRKVGPRLAQRFARALLELGGNNAAIVAPSADLTLALKAMVFSAVGTAGQRCTTLRRAFVHESVYDQVRDGLLDSYRRVPIGDPRQPGVLMGPLIDRAAFDGMQAALEQARTLGWAVHGGGRVREELGADAFYVAPALVEAAEQAGPMVCETFAPILYLTRYRELDEAIAWQNAVPQGLSSCMFTTDLREAERFTSERGSDCGIANVNIGPSGAEIGGAFGGEKETGGGRESGSDSWRAYMRRQTSTTNYGAELPLAQAVRFDL